MHIKRILISITIIILVTDVSILYAKISAEELNRYSNAFIVKLKKDNKNYNAEINKYLKGMIKDGNAGIRLADKLGLFLYNCRSQQISVRKTRFFINNRTFYLFIVLQEVQDEQEYTLYLEYEYDEKGNSCLLKDIYFSMILKEKMNEIEKFFRVR